MGLQPCKCGLTKETSTQIKKRDKDKDINKGKDNIKDKDKVSAHRYTWSFVRVLRLPNLFATFA